MKKNGFWKGFGSGLILTVLIAALCVTATATSKRSIQVEDGIGITLNGATFTPRNANGKEVSVFLYNGTTYVPVRAISEAMGMDVSFNSATRTVVLTTADRTASQQGSTTASGDYISVDRAKQIALNNAGVKESNAVFLRANLDWDDGRQVYDVEFYTKDYREYDYEIDAATGEILSYDYDAEGYSYQPNATPGTAITAEQARAIALAEVPGAAESDIYEFETDRDDGRLEYEGKIIYNNTEYEFTIDGYSGAIREWDAEPFHW